MKQLMDFIKDEFSSINYILRKHNIRINYKDSFVARVEKHAKYLTPDEVSYGIGAVQISSDQAAIGAGNEFWVRPYRLRQGEFRVPPVGSYVLVFYPFSEEMPPHYLGGFCWDSVTSSRDPDAVNKEKIGWYNLNPLSDGWDSPRMIEARTNPDTNYVFDSTKDFIFGVDETKKIVDLRAVDGYETHITTGDGGKVVIGNYQPLTKQDLGNTEIEIRPGTTGKLTIKFSNGITQVWERDKLTISDSTDTERMMMDFSSKELEFDFSKVTFKSDQGDVVIKDGEVQADMEVSAMNSSARVGLSTHTHATSIPGPPVPGVG